MFAKFPTMNSLMKRDIQQIELSDLLGPFLGLLQYLELFWGAAWLQINPQEVSEEYPDIYEFEVKAKIFWRVLNRNGIWKDGSEFKPISRISLNSTSPPSTSLSSVFTISNAATLAQTQNPSSFKQIKYQ